MTHALSVDKIKSFQQNAPNFLYCCFHNGELFHKVCLVLNDGSKQKSDTKAIFNRFLWDKESFNSYLHIHFFTIVIPKSVDMYAFKKLNNKKTILKLI